MVTANEKIIKIKNKYKKKASKELKQKFHKTLFGLNLVWSNTVSVASHKTNL